MDERYNRYLAVENFVHFDHVYTTDDGLYITFAVAMKSGYFACRESFCNVRTDLEVAVQQMNEMYRSLQGASKITDYDSNSSFEFKMEKTGHLDIGWFIDVPDRCIKIGIRLDQTDMPDIIRRFKQILIPKQTD